MQIEKAMATPAADRTSREAPVRVPFGGFSYKLEVANKDPAFWYYWFKDTGDTIKRALRAGYQFVSQRESGDLTPEALTNRDVNGANESVSGDTRKFGGRDEYGREYQLVLMKQPIEFHEADMQAENAKADEVDQAIFRQGIDRNNVATKYGNVTMTVKDEE